MGAAGGPPIDRGYAWVIAFGAFFNLFIIMSVAKSLGIIFVGLREFYQRSATSTAVLYPLLAASSLMMGPVVTALCEKFTVRAVCMCGAVLTSVGLVIGYFGTSLEMVIIPYGIIGGLGGGMVLNPAPLIVSRYFDRRKSLAMGCLFAGTGVGGIIGPFVVAGLMDEFGLHASILLIGAINLHTLIGSALYRPIDSWGAAAPSTDTKAAHHKLRPIPEEEDVDSFFESSDDDEEKKEEREENEAEAAVYRSALSLSSLDIPGAADLTKLGRQTSAVTSMGRFRRIFHRTSEGGVLVPILDFSVLGNPSFVFFALGCLCGMAGFYWNMLTPAYCEEDLGMGATETARLLSVMGAGDLCGRIAIGVSGDRWLSSVRPLSVGLCLLLISATVAVCPFFPSFFAQAVSVFLGTLGFGGFVALGPVALGDLVSSDSLPSAWGFLLFFEGLGHIATPLAIGVIKDTYGSYFAGYFFVSAACLLGGALIVTASVIHQFGKKSTGGATA